MPRFKTAQDEAIYYDNLAQSFINLQIREKHGWTFEKYVSLHERGDLQAVLNA